MDKQHFFNLTLPFRDEAEMEFIEALLYANTQFESILEEDSEILVCYDTKHQDIDELKNFLKENHLYDKARYEFVEQQNWNAVFESNFQPLIFLDGKWGIRASFHKPLHTENELIVDPKMSFGTGHHETTQSMIALMDREDLGDKSVFDYGSGTGILAMIAAKMGAFPVYAIDNEEWAYHNSIENAAMNEVSYIHFFHGDLAQSMAQNFLEKEKTYQIILANITRNILLESAETLAQLTAKEGILLCSGFYDKDLEDIKNGFEAVGFRYDTHIVENHWVAAKFVK